VTGASLPAAAGASPAEAEVDAGPRGPLSLRREPFGTAPGGHPVERFTFANGRGVQVQMITYGAILQTLHAPDRHGRIANVTLGLRTVDDYVAHSGPYFGATIGRYANRIAGGRFTLDGTSYQIPVNNGPHALHGGTVGFDKKVWQATEVRTADSIGVRFGYRGPAGEMGFPGALTTTATYTLNTRDELVISYLATTDAPTVLNLTNHAYFNLAGEGSGTVYDHVLTIDAPGYLPTDAASIPLGPVAPVAGTPFDFNRATAIGARIRDDDPQLLMARGYDHTYVLDRPGRLRRVAVARDPRSGRVLTVATDQPGVQLYTGNFLDGSIAGISGRAYRQSDGFCLETQHFPDSPNHPAYPSTVLRPGERFTSTTVYGLSAR